LRSTMTTGLPVSGWLVGLTGSTVQWSLCLSTYRVAWYHVYLRKLGGMRVRGSASRKLRCSSVEGLLQEYCVCSPEESACCRPRNPASSFLDFKSRLYRPEEVFFCRQKSGVQPLPKRGLFHSSRVLGWPNGQLQALSGAKQGCWGVANSLVKFSSKWSGGEGVCCRVRDPLSTHIRGPSRGCTSTTFLREAGCGSPTQLYVTPNT